MSESSLRKAELLGQQIGYEVRHSERAQKARIDVGLNGVTVVIPEGSSRNPVDLLQENAAWVIEKNQEYEQYRDKIPERRFEEGATFPYLGEPHEVVVEQRPSSEVADGTFLLAKHHVEQTSIKRALETLYRRKARGRFEEGANRLSEEVGVDYEKIEIRNQRTKWGSCSSTGTLGLNWRLMMAPPEIVKYVLVHEISHLRIPNHTDEFWDLISRHDPNYVEHANWLEENSPRLIFSKDDL